MEFLLAITTSQSSESLSLEKHSFPHWMGFYLSGNWLHDEGASLFLDCILLHCLILGQRHAILNVAVT